uniref:Synaptonemal complex protein 2 n=1 Tax=Knipowitschia caucasica TaxID=637954 RepID=A0AAV2LY02_KNICA
MPLSEYNLLETIIDDATPNLQIQALNFYLQRDFDKHITIQCSQQFLNKLDKFISKSLKQGHCPAACLGFTVIYKYGKNLKLPTAEDFLDALIEIQESGKTGSIQVTESFLYPISQMAVDPRINILIQKEAIRKFNLILDKSPMKLKKDGKMLQSQEAAHVMSNLANRIIDGGDYDFQTALMEALCRMATCEQRRQLADRWFTMEHVSTAFVKIKDSEFETDCRKFLNLVNGIKGDKRSVFSFPCLEVFLGKNELLMPADEKLEEFWIDFNIGSHSISFYFSLPDGAQEEQWETICINENEVKSYTVKEGKRKMLNLDMSEVVIVGSVDGSSLTIHFSSGLDILPVVQKVFGSKKNTSFVRKTGASVAKTTVKMVIDQNSATSQTVPESQMSLGESEKCGGSMMKTPAKMRASESTNFISSSGGGGARSVSSVLPAAKCKGKPSLTMVRSVERQEQNGIGELRTAKSSLDTTPVIARREKDMNETKKMTYLTKPRATIVSEPKEVEPPLDSTFVPDSQPTTSRNISSTWHKFSVSEMLMLPTQKMGSLPKSGSPQISAQRKSGPSSVLKTSAPSSGPVHPKQFHTELTQRLQQVLHERNKSESSQSVDFQKGKVSDTKEKPKSNNAVVAVALNLPDLKEKRPRRSTRSKGNCKPQVEEDTCVMKAPGRAAVKSATLSKKEKRDAEVTGKMVKHISSHYEVKVKGKRLSQFLIPPSPLIGRPFFNMKWHTCMGNVTTLVQSKSKERSQSKDVFAFNVDTPQSIGVNRAITSSTRIGFSEDSSLPSTNKKQQPPPKTKRHVKKHLFSDTDTDRGTTDVSWLRESSRKPKPKVTKYPRAAPTKTKVALTLPSSDSPKWTDPYLVPCPKPDVIAQSTKVKAQPQQKKKETSAAALRAAAIRRSSRAAAHSLKSYREMDSEGSQSDSELFKVGKFEKTNLNGKNNNRKLQSKPFVEPEIQISSQSDSEAGHTVFSMCAVNETKQKKRSNFERVANKKLRTENVFQDFKKSREEDKSVKPANILKESAKKKNVAPVKEQSGSLKESWAQRQAMSSPLSFIERMRSAERSGPSLDLPCSPVLSLQASPLTFSPNPDAPEPLTHTPPLPKPCSTVTSAGDFKALKQRASRTQSIKSVTSMLSLTQRGHCKPFGSGRTCADQSPAKEDLSSCFQSPLSLSRPLLTSTLVNKECLSLPSLPPSPQLEAQGSFNKISPVSAVSLSRVSTKSSVTDKEADRASAALRTEKTPQMDVSLLSAEDVMSGPSHKRHMLYSSSNNSDEEDKEKMKKSKARTQHSPRMKPRKLFKSTTKTHELIESWEEHSAVDKSKSDNMAKAAKKKSEEENISVKKRRLSAEGSVSHLLSSSHTVTSGHWDADTEDGDIDDLDTPRLNPKSLCHEFSCKLKQKFKSRFRMVDVYNKQSLKTFQQHISTIDSEVAKHRALEEEQVQRVLLEEIHKLEQGDTLLKTMENDLTIHWNKQSVSFRSLQKQEKKRTEVLKNTLQNNVCHSLGEERLFTSQMCLIRNDMKSAQDRLLTEMTAQSTVPVTHYSGKKSEAGHMHNFIHYTDHAASSKESMK